MAKKRTVSRKDRVSELSTDMIGYILERMSAQDAARTTLLLNQYQNQQIISFMSSIVNLVSVGVNEAIGVVNYMEAEVEEDAHSGRMKVITKKRDGGLGQICWD
ncbi:hypothetical protein LguiB_001733 [Lonicera macranthoides]